MQNTMKSGAIDMFTGIGGLGALLPVRPVIYGQIRWMWLSYMMMPTLSHRRRVCCKANEVRK